MRKNRKIYLLLMALSIIGFWVFENFYTPAEYSVAEEGRLETAPVPENLLPASSEREVVRHAYYMLAYDEATEQAAWVAYMLRPEHLSREDRERPYFIEDPFVKTKSADWRNYRGSGYDRGHLLPAGDRRFSIQAYNETFYTSNISPQDREFNAGIWNDLEQQVRAWCRRYGPLLVVTGGVLQPGLPTIGDEDVAVPQAFYKIIYRQGKKGPELIAFLIPNRDTRQPLQNFIVSVDSLEALTGIDFFAALEGAEAMEARPRTSAWKFR